MCEEAQCVYLCLYLGQKSVVVFVCLFLVQNLIQKHMMHLVAMFLSFPSIWSNYLVFSSLKDTLTPTFATAHSVSCATIEVTESQGAELSLWGGGGTRGTQSVLICITKSIVKP